MAIVAGLFDGAINYLWNETIAALRRLVLKFDLQYFFSIAEKIDSRQRKLSTEEHLDQIGDHDLLLTCHRIGLLSDVNLQRLSHVDYMRNHTSAAHPNDHEIESFEILSGLQVCIRHVINAEPEHSVISVKRLLNNIRAVAIPVQDLPAICDEIVRMQKERIDDLLWTIFGMYTDPKSTAQTKGNVAQLAPNVWSASTEDRRFEIGAKVSFFMKNAEVVRKEAAEEFLKIVGGMQYRDEESLAGELIDKLETLKRVHFGHNNFYSEYTHALALGAALPISGRVPRAARSLWVKVISIGYIGNGHGYRDGVDEAALEYYIKYIDCFTEAEVVEFLHLFNDTEFNSVIHNKKTDKRARMLAQHIKKNQSNIHIQRVLELIINFPEHTLAKIVNAIEYKRALEFVPKHK